MNDTKDIGLDVYQATISAAVLDSAGKLVMEAILETKAETILQFIHGLRGSLRVTLEERTWHYPSERAAVDLRQRSGLRGSRRGRVARIIPLIVRFL